MKRSLKNVFLTCTAIAAMATAFATTSFAATYNSDGTVTVDQDWSAYMTKQVTMLILKPGTDDTNVKDSDIVQIDQEAAAAGTFKAIPVGTLAEGTYTVKMGGETVDSIITETFTVGEVTDPTPTPSANPSVIYGDVDGSGGVEMADALMVMQYVSENISLSEKEKAAANVTKFADGDNDITVADALMILQKVSENIADFGEPK